MESKVLASGNGSLYYWTSDNLSSSKETLFFTHGIVADHTVFNKQVEYFSDNFNIITWDLPQHGQSRPYNCFSYQDFAKQMKMILDNEKITKAVFIGHSMGGHIVQKFASMYKDYVSNLILVDTNPLGTEFYPSIDQWVIERKSKVASLFSYTTLINTLALTTSKTAYAYEVFHQVASDYSRNEILMLIDNCTREFLQDTKTIHFSCPTMLIYGEYDELNKVAENNQKWAAKENIPLNIIPNASHNSFMDNPTEFNSLLEEFIYSEQLDFSKVS